MSGALVVFAKDPRPGAVKTRLSPPLSPEQAASLYRCMLVDALSCSRDAARRVDATLVLALHPPEAVARWREILDTEIEVRAQEGRDLSTRMSTCFAALRAEGFERIVLRGSDSPALPAALLVDAFAALERCDLVLGPDRAEGYNLVGARVPIPGLFDHPMSTASVLEDTLANARRSGLETSLLAPSDDIDVAADLLRLQAAHERGKSPSPCPRTLEFLDRFQLWPDAADT